MYELRRTELKGAGVLGGVSLRAVGSLLTVCRGFAGRPDKMLQVPLVSPARWKSASPFGGGGGGEGCKVGLNQSSRAYM